MRNIKKFLKLCLGKSAIVNIVPPIRFDGWKMATGTQPPWLNGGGTRLAREFIRCDAELSECVSLGKIILTQFRQKFVADEIAQLKWRHYIVFWTSVVASKIPGDEKRNFVEMGVCDGLTAWYASKARQSMMCSGEFFLYDAWEGMRSDLLTYSEMKSAGSYDYLDIQNTKKNLAYCGNDKFIFNKGYIPESFSFSRNPEHVAWMHIDLNSSISTVSSLNYFWDRLLPGGLILFDDYAWPGYEDTKVEIENWCDHRNLDIFQFPTGQALINKPLK